MKTNQDGLQVLPWHREAAKETYNHIGDWAYVSGVEPIAAIIARHDPHALPIGESANPDYCIRPEAMQAFNEVADALQGNATEIATLKAQHAKTLRLLERAMDYFAVECYGSDLYKEIRAHLATQSHLSAKEKGTQ